MTAEGGRFVHQQLLKLIDEELPELRWAVHTTIVDETVAKLCYEGVQLYGSAAWWL